MIVKKILRADEGLRLKPYYDHLGYPTIGIGTRIPGTKQHDPLPDITWTKEQAFDAMNERIEYVIKTLSSNDFKNIFPNLNEVRQAVLISMAYQVGIYGLLKFRQMRIALLRNDFQIAANEIIDSDAWRDPKTRDRFTRNAEMMRTGKLLEYYK